ncbi:MAG TPA: tetratricopeptide repeat protein [Bacteroidia bacterium]
MSDSGGELSDSGGELSDNGGELSDSGGELSDNGGELSDIGGELSDNGGELSDNGGELSDIGGELSDNGGGSTKYVCEIKILTLYLLFLTFAALKQNSIMKKLTLTVMADLVRHLIRLRVKPAMTLFLFLFVIARNEAISQNKKIDSLWNVYNNKAQPDTARLKAINKIAFQYTYNKPDTAIILAEQMLKLAKTSKQKKYEAEYFNIMGMAFTFKGDKPKALPYYIQQLKIWEELGNKKQIERCTNVIRGMNITKSNPNPDEEKENQTKFFEKVLKELKTAEEKGDKEGMSSCNWMIGDIYTKQKNYPKAMEYLNKALQLYEERGAKSNIGICYSSIGKVYEAQIDYPKALDYYLKSLKIVKETGSKPSSLSLHYIDMGNIYTKLANYKVAIPYYDSALQIAKGTGTIVFQRRVYGYLADAYFKNEQYKEAYNAHVTFKTLTDSVFNTENSKQLSDMQTKFEVEKKEVVLKAEQDKKDIATAEEKKRTQLQFEFEQEQQTLKGEKEKRELAFNETLKRKQLTEDYNKKKAIEKASQEKRDALAQEEKQKARIIIFAVAGVLLIVLVFSLLLYKRFKLTNQQKHIIEEKNKDITDSITYALRIQQAKLPKKEEIYAALPQCFVLFKPKDIVSGDFYYFHQVSLSFGEGRKGEVGGAVFIAACDCTGHGVPGAFMSMIGSDKLEDAVSASSNTSEILSLLNKGIKTALKQSEEDDSSTRDGMDIALCCIDIENRMVKYAGANRPFWLIRNGQIVVEEIKATKKAIGGFTEDTQHYDSHEIQLQQGDTFYLSTDGFADTFSGADSKKLTTKKFKQILLDIQNKTMQEQEHHLATFIENWKAGTEQVDDILVIGVRI